MQISISTSILETFFSQSMVALFIAKKTQFFCLSTLF